MKKIIFTIAVLLVNLVSMAQKPEYLQAMGETLGGFSGASGVTDFQELGNKFQMIATAEKGEWLPLYYHAQCYVLMSMMEQDVAKKDSYLDVAEKSVNAALELVPNESEVVVLQAFFQAGRLMVNPMERGPQYGEIIMSTIGKAIALDANNPRAKMLKLQMDMGMAQYMGQDPKSFCPLAKELLASWDNYKLKSPIHPNWGKEQVEGIVKGCE